MNSIKLNGKVLSVFKAKNGYFGLKIITVFNHYLKNDCVRVEQTFNVFMTDFDKGLKIGVLEGDVVNILGYLKTDFRLSATSKERKKLVIYATDIKICN